MDSPRAAANKQSNGNNSNHEPPEQHNICLELRPFGGIEGVVSNLLRLTQRRVYPSSALVDMGPAPDKCCPSAGDKNAIQLGTALLACAVTELTARSLQMSPKLIERRRYVDVTATASRAMDGKQGGTGGYDDQSNHDLIISPVEAKEGWGAMTLAAVVKILQGSTIAGEPRVNLLATLVSLGNCLQETGVAGGLLDIITGGIAQKDKQCCRCVSRALAVGLHSNPAFCREIAGQLGWIKTLLALVFPGRFLPPSSSTSTPLFERDAATRTTTISERREEIANGMWRCNETQENALSCLCSITQSSIVGVKNICVLKAMKDLLRLAFEEEEDISDAHNQESTTSNWPLSHPPRKSSIGNKRRPMTTGTLPSKPRQMHVVKKRSEGKTEAHTAESVRPRLQQGNINARGLDADGLFFRGSRATTKQQGQGNERVPRCEGYAEEDSNVSAQVASTEGNATGNEHPPRPSLLAPTPQQQQQQRQHWTSMANEAPNWSERRALLATRCLLNCLHIHNVSGDVGSDNGDGRPATISERHTLAQEKVVETEEAVKAVRPTGMEAQQRRERQGSSCRSRRRQHSSSRGLSTINSQQRNATKPHSTPTANDVRAGPSTICATKEKLSPAKNGLSWRRKSATAGNDEPSNAGDCGHCPDPVQPDATAVKQDEEIHPTITCARIQRAGNEVAAVKAVALMVSAELAALEATTKGVLLLEAASPLHQELGVALIGNGLLEEEDLEGAYTRGHGKGYSSADPRTTKTRQQLRTLLVRKGYLRLLCWLLLHHSPGVSTGAARVLSSFANLSTVASMNGNEYNSSAHHHVDERGDYWMLSVVEQGCVPILRIAAGKRIETILETASSPKKTSTRSADSNLLLPRENGDVSAAKQTALEGDSEAMREGDWICLHRSGLRGDPLLYNPSADFDTGEYRDRRLKAKRRAVGRAKSPNEAVRETARGLLSVIGMEVFGATREPTTDSASSSRHIARLVRVVKSSGNRELRANVALAVVLLSVESEGGVGGEARKFFVDNDALSPTLGMLRSPTGRPAAVSFLKMMVALQIEGSQSQPPDFFAIAAREDVRNVDEGVGPSFSGEGDAEDTVVLVKDPLACLGRGGGGTGCESRGGSTEAEGIKMACPSREVMFKYSSVLQRLLDSVSPGELPVLHGRYRAWEEVMAHMGAPHTFLCGSGRYSTPFLIELFLTAATSRIQGLADGYAWELWRRLQYNGDTLSSPPPSQPKTIAIGSNQPIVRFDTLLPSVHQASTETTTPTGHDTTTTDATNGSTRTRSKKHTKRPLTGPADVASLASAEPISPDESFDTGKAINTQAEGSEEKESSKIITHPHEPPELFALLEASLKGRHAWLCASAFRVASVRMGQGNGEGLPARPRDLTALLDLLRRVLSLLLAGKEEPLP